MMSHAERVADARNWVQMIDSRDEMSSVAGELAQLVRPGFVMYFEGGLGVGKTTMIQDVFQHLGVGDTVLSPTFSILKPYTLASGFELLHVDLYRIDDPAELLLIGIEDFLDTECAWFIEWPARGADVIPPPDICVELHHAGSGRQMRVRMMS